MAGIPILRRPARDFPTFRVEKIQHRTHRYLRVGACDTLSTRKAYPLEPGLEIGHLSHHPEGGLLLAYRIEY